MLIKVWANPTALCSNKKDGGNHPVVTVCDDNGTRHVQPFTATRDGVELFRTVAEDGRMLIEYEGDYLTPLAK